MAKVGKVQRKSNCRHRVTPYPLPSHSSKVLKDVQQKKKRSKAPEIKQWDDATCSVCMEYPHNAVLLLCSSYDKGCRPYMCATSSRYSNCLEQYKKAYTKVSSTQIAEPWLGSIDESGFLGLGCLSEKTQVSELLCPLCRGQVKGWTVVEPARKYFNTKRRTCMQDNCSYVGTYKELRKHVKAEHPCACPREVDPTLAEKWKRLEHEREREDVMSTIRSSMPGAIVMGDYVIERNYRGSFSGDYDVDDYLGDAIFRLESFGGGGNGHHVNSSHGLFESDHQYSWDEEEDIDLNHDANVSASGNFDDNFISRFTRYRSRLLSGRLRRRRRRRRAVNLRNLKPREHLLMVESKSRSQMMMITNQMVKPTTYSSKIITDIPLSESPAASFDQYLDDKPRVFNAIFPDKRRSQQLNEEEWRIQMLPIHFLLLTVWPVIDMRLRCKSKGIDYPPGVPRDITKVVEVEIIRWELQGLDDFLKPSEFTLGVKGALYSDRRESLSRLKIQLKMSISFVLPAVLALVPEDVHRGIVESVLDRMVENAKHRVNGSLLADYSEFKREKLNAIF